MAVSSQSDDKSINAEKSNLEQVPTFDVGTVDSPVAGENTNALHRRLGNRQIQLIAIGNPRCLEHNQTQVLMADFAQVDPSAQVCS